MRYTVKPQMITLQTLKDRLLHERSLMTIDENVDNTNPIDYIIKKRTALIIISITVLQWNWMKAIQKANVGNFGPTQNEIELSML